MAWECCVFLRVWPGLGQTLEFSALFWVTPKASQKKKVRSKTPKSSSKKKAGSAKKSTKVSKKKNSKKSASQDLSSLKCTELRELLKKKGLSLTGRKADLIARLQS